MFDHPTRLAVMVDYFTTSTTQYQLAIKYKTSIASISRIVNSIEAGARYPAGRKRTRRKTTDEEIQLREILQIQKMNAEENQDPAVRAAKRKTHRKCLEITKQARLSGDNPFNRDLDADEDWDRRRLKKLNDEYPDDPDILDTDYA
jgi:hypothetical protein